MANSREIVRYKQQIVSLLINNEDIVNLINQEGINSPEDLIYHNIYDFIRIPDVPEEQKTFICVEVDVPEVYSVNFLFKKLVIYVHVITHQGLMITDLGGARTDLLAAEVDEMLNGYRGIGQKPLELISNVAERVGEKHRGRVLTFLASDINVDPCKKTSTR